MTPRRLFFFWRDLGGRGRIASLPVLTYMDSQDLGEAGMYAVDNMGIGLRTV